jgi:NDP-sugar pyrophosphorylase family protein
MGRQAKKTAKIMKLFTFFSFKKREKKHFKLTREYKVLPIGAKLHRIKCTRAISGVNVGELGGWVEKMDNLCGNAWVSDEACVFDNAQVSGNARVCDNAMVSENARVEDNARVFDNAGVCQNARVGGNARVFDNACVSGMAYVFDCARVRDSANVYGEALVSGGSCIYENAEIYGNGDVKFDSYIGGEVNIGGNARVEYANLRSLDDYCCFQSFGYFDYEGGARRHRTITAFRRTSGEVKIIYDWHTDTVKEFEKRVKQEYGYNHYGKELIAIIDVIKIKFELE